MAHDVFISYSSKDKPIADAACAVLEAAGVRCWIAPRDIRPGTDWGEAIIDAIAGSRAMVLIFSANANASPQIKREVERAVNREVVVVPFRIEDVRPSKSLEYFISTPHWMDAYHGPLDEHLGRLAVTLRSLVPEAAARPVPGSTGAAAGRANESVGRHASAAAAGPTRANRGHGWVAPMAGAAAVAVAAGVVMLKALDAGPVQPSAARAVDVPAPSAERERATPAPARTPAAADPPVRATSLAVTQSRPPASASPVPAAPPPAAPAPAIVIVPSAPPAAPSVSYGTPTERLVPQAYTPPPASPVAPQPPSDGGQYYRVGSSGSSDYPPPAPPDWGPSGPPGGGPPPPGAGRPPPPGPGPGGRPRGPGPRR